RGSRDVAGLCTRCQAGQADPSPAPTTALFPCNIVGARTLVTSGGLCGLDARTAHRRSLTYLSIDIHLREQRDEPPESFGSRPRPRDMDQSNGHAPLRSAPPT